MKKLVMSIMVTLVMVFGGTSFVKAEEVETVQGVLNEIQQVAETKEEITKEVNKLTINELNSIRDYLEEKPDITVKEQQVLEITYEVTYGDNKFRRVEQDTIKGKEERDASIRDAKELVDGYTQDEKFEIYEILQEKREDDRTEEENILLDAIKEDFNDKYMGTFIKITIALIIAGIVLSLVDVKYSKSLSLGLYGFIGLVLLSIGLTLGLLLLGGSTNLIVTFFN